MMQDIITPGSVVFTEEAETEPVTLTEAKAYIRVGYDTEDTYITSLITAARQWVESMAGVSVIKRTVSCRVELYNSIELPYGPVIGDPTVTDPGDGVMFTPGIFRRITGGCGVFDVIYQAGYDPCPEGLKMAILARVAAMFENRGDNADSSNHSQVAKSHYLPFKRIVQWL
jgi:hypothetical protein